MTTGALIAFTQLKSYVVSVTSFNSLRPRQNGCLFADDTFKRIFLNENIRISTKNSLKIVPKGLINNIPALVLIMAWRRPSDKPLSEPMLVRSLTHICVTRPQWVKGGGEHNWLPKNNSLIGIILGMGSANERRHYNVMSALIGWAHTQNVPCNCPYPCVSTNCIWNVILVMNIKCELCSL